VLYLSNYFGLELIFVDGAEVARVGGGGGIVAGQGDGGGLDGDYALDNVPTRLDGHYHLAGTGFEPSKTEQGVTRPVGWPHAVARYPVEPEWRNWHLELGFLGDVENFGYLANEVE
jgi:hypothetical protein